MNLNTISLPWYARPTKQIKLPCFIDCVSNKSSYVNFFVILQMPFTLKVWKEKTIYLSHVKKGPKKFLSKLWRAKYHWRRTPLKAWNFYSWLKSSIIIALGYVNHYLWKQLTQTYTHTEPHFQRKLSDVQLSLGGSSSRYGGAWSFEEEATCCQLLVFFLFLNCPTIIITLIWTRSPRTRRRSKSFQTHNINNNITTNSINLVLCNNTTLMIAAS
jgi:hypothetical protein